MPPVTSMKLGSSVTWPSLEIQQVDALKTRNLLYTYMEFRQNIQSFVSALHFKAGIGTPILDGSKSLLERLSIINQWQQGVQVDGLPACVLISTSVLKAGVNLSAVDQLILMVSWWGNRASEILSIMF